MARKTIEEAERTRRALIEAGESHFAEFGYAGVALEELIASLGVTRGALYHHFGSKRGFFEAVVERVQKNLGAKILRASERAGHGWDGIEAGCMTFLGAATDPTYQRIVIIDGPAVLGWEKWKELDDEYLTSSLNEGLTSLKGGTSAKDYDSEALAVALSGAMNELALWVAHGDKPRAALRRARAVIRSLLRVSRGNAR